MNDESSPSADQLDRLRAGLLDDDPALKSKVEMSLAADGRAIARAALWKRVNEELDRGLERFPTLANQLRLRRREVLAGKRRSHAALPLVAGGAAAMLTLAVAISTFQGSPQPEQAAAPVEPAVATAAAYQVQTVADDRLDLATNLDFYVWLANQREAAQAEHREF